MRKFTDTQGEVWKVDVTVSTLLDIQTQLGYDLFESIDKLPKSLAGQVQLLATICMEQIEERKLSERDFAKRLAGEPFAQAIDCVLRELADFLSHHKPALGLIMRRTLEEMHVQVEAEMELADKECSKHFGSSQVSRESTPAH